MKKTIIIFLLLSIYSLAQENRLIRQNDLTDSLDAIRTLIGTGGIALPDSVLFSTDSTAQRTFSDLKYQTKGYANVKDYGAVGDSLTDDTQAFQNAINTGKRVYVPTGVYTVDSLVMTSNSVLFGDGVSSKICLSNAGTTLINIESDSYYLGLGNVSNIKISNIWISGLGEVAFKPYNPIGTRTGIHIDGAHDIYIDNVKMTGFNLAAFIGEHSDAGGTYSTNTHVSNCDINSNYYGLWIKDKFEYGFYENNFIQGYTTGVKVAGGNNTFLNNQILNGYVGFHFQQGSNDAHGSVTGGSVNHNTFYSFLIDSIRTTEIINGVNIWYGHIKFDFSRGVKFMNCMVRTDSIWFTGGDCANSGFINCTFDDLMPYISRDKGVDQSIMKNNNFWGTLSGLTTTIINDVDITPYDPHVNGLPTVIYNKIDSSYTEVTGTNDINFGVQDFSIEWFGYVKPDGTFQSIVNKESSSQYFGYSLAISSDNVFQFQIVGIDSSTQTGNSPTITEGYYHIVVTKQDTNVAFYINGDSLDILSRPLYTKGTSIPTGWTSYAGASVSNNGNLKIGVFGHLEPGTFSPVNFYDGGMNLIRLYNFAVSYTQAKNMFTLGLPNLSEVPYKYKWGNQDSLTSGTLVLGKTYIIDDYVSGDDFTNIGGTNADSSIFIATGTTPTTWTNSSILRKLGCVAEYRAENSGVATWEDNSDNGLDGTNTNVVQNYSTYTIPVTDTTGVTDGYVLKYVGGGLIWSPDVATAGAGLFNPDGVTLDTTGAGLARISLAWQDSVHAKMNRSEMTGYATASHTHIDFFDTLTVSWGVLDTTYAGALTGWKVPNDITITEISAYTDANTCTFNLEERGETTPNTAGTDVMSSDLVADTDQQETTTFTNANIAKNAWLVPTISATGDVSIFAITVRYIKTD